MFKNALTLEKKILVVSLENRWVRRVENGT
jgi:hypothetical protein